ncbi:hypothetical protein EJ08DRAFT_733173 [Tothia fuscella]|uniref:BTB domain-containing protein n=1 Tax=Tothia fuscella TaxID=1048955 RepID=A0A9P4NUB0_9PEZI|nr:hypothetical protein EJ08DRAFT_733173 [Tothia fuscella]
MSSGDGSESQSSLPHRGARPGDWTTMPTSGSADKDYWVPDYFAQDETFITIKVGKEEETYHIYRSLLCAASQYFHNLFLGPFTEGSTREAKVEDTSPRTFKLFQAWLYCGVIRLPPDSTNHVDTRYPVRVDESDDSDDARAARIANAKIKTHPTKCPKCGGISVRNAEPSTEWIDTDDDLLDLYVFADQYQIPLLRREVIITLQWNSTSRRSLTDLSIVIRAYESLPHNSTFCQWLVLTYALHYRTYSGNTNDKHCDCPRVLASINTEVDVEAFHPVFAHQLIISKFSRRHKELEVNGFSWCEFHEHVDEDQAQKCRFYRASDGRYSPREHPNPELVVRTVA